MTDTGEGDVAGESRAVVESRSGQAWSETDHDFGLRPQDVSVVSHFDAFNADTWNFRPAPVPWHESPKARLTIIAVALALITLVVSVVLLAVTGSPDSSDQAPKPQTSTAPTTTATTEPPSAIVPPPPPPPPPSSEAPPPAPVYQRPREQPRQSKEPEINVTRTPVTRSQLSVAPQRPSGNR